MKVILLDEVKALGKKGDIVEVKDGYAMNFLMPQKMALPASKSNKSMLENLKKQQRVKEARDKEEAEALSKRLGHEKIVIESKSGESGKLYGSITSQDIADAITAKLKIDVDKRKIVLEHPIKETGKHQVKIKLFHDVEATLNIEVKGVEEKTA
ncbi:MAG: 50S ribosomal protein L9 [Candidatus Wallbacteria bacterium]|nr:50S ribosomal protein L9 [Candidatus Wallbacteria bacterium]